MYTSQIYEEAKGWVFNCQRNTLVGALFWVGTPHSSIPLCITSRSCQGEMQRHRITCLLRIIRSLQIMSLEAFILKKKNRKFLLCITFWGLSKCSNSFKLHKLQKISTQYKHSLVNQLGIAKMFCSVWPTQNSREQMFYSIHNLHGTAEIFYWVWPTRNNQN